MLSLKCEAQLKMHGSKKFTNPQTFPGTLLEDVLYWNKNDKGRGFRKEGINLRRVKGSPKVIAVQQTLWGIVQTKGEGVPQGSISSKTVRVYDMFGCAKNS